MTQVTDSRLNLMFDRREVDVMVAEDRNQCIVESRVCTENSEPTILRDILSSSIAV